VYEALLELKKLSARGIGLEQVLGDVGDKLVREERPEDRLHM
jgi:hypothetical protein